MKSGDVGEKNQDPRRRHPAHACSCHRSRRRPRLLKSRLRAPEEDASRAARPLMPEAPRTRSSRARRVGAERRVGTNPIGTLARRGRSARGKWMMAAAGGAGSLLLPRLASPFMLEFVNGVVVPQLAAIFPWILRLRDGAARAQPAAALATLGWRGTRRFISRRGVAATAAVSSTVTLRVARLLSRAANGAARASASVGTGVVVAERSSRPSTWLLLGKVARWLAEPLVPASWRPWGGWV